MARINQEGYVERRVNGSGRKLWRDLWLIQERENGQGQLQLKISFKRNMVGKRIRIKIENIEEENAFND